MFMWQVFTRILQAGLARAGILSAMRWPARAQPLAVPGAFAAGLQSDPYFNVDPAAERAFNGPPGTGDYARSNGNTWKKSACISRKTRESHSRAVCEEDKGR
jgi:hypothetical protein